MKSKATIRTRKITKRTMQKYIALFQKRVVNYKRDLENITLSCASEDKDKLSSNEFGTDIPIITTTTTASTTPIINHNNNDNNNNNGNKHSSNKNNKYNIIGIHNYSVPLVSGCKINELVSYICTLPYYCNEISEVLYHKKKEAIFGPNLPFTENYSSEVFTVPLAYPLQVALLNSKISRLYLHQIKAINASLEGRNVAVCTSTSSGKSLVYNISVMQAILKDPASSAIYLYPTKALAQDQLRSLRNFLRGGTEALLHVKCFTYDGDVPQESRGPIQRDAHVVLTNPDMLHFSMLPGHVKWERFFRTLKHVVIDEAHTYRGVFGSHMAMILRRLVRLCCHYGGSQPQFIVCSATIANPVEHFMQLIHCTHPPTLIQEDTSPSGAKYYMFWRSGPTKRSELRESGDIAEISVSRPAELDAALLLIECVSQNHRTMVFCKSRSACELVYSYAQKIILCGLDLYLSKNGGACIVRTGPFPHLASCISSYRGGYPAAVRRNIESTLFDGSLLGVVCTNALELGIDLGFLDVTIQLGYPGSKASFLQQAGRAGRNGHPSLAIFIAKLPSPIDNYIAQKPAILFKPPVERAVVNPFNKHILWQHLLCAAHELSLHGALDQDLFGIQYFEKTIQLLRDGIGPNGVQLSCGPLVYHRADCYTPTFARPSPWKDVNIRCITEDTCEVLLEGTDETTCIDSLELTNALYSLHPGAVYLHRGTQYLVSHLDWDNRKAHVERQSVSYCTRPVDRSEIVMLSKIEEGYINPLHGAHQKLLVNVNIRTTITHYQKLTPQCSYVVLETIPLHLPTVEYNTCAIWLELPGEIISALARGAFDNWRAAAHTTAHALCLMTALYLMCDSTDVSTLCPAPDESANEPTNNLPPAVLLYDGRAGSAGLCKEAFPRVYELLEEAYDFISKCPCEAGCIECFRNDHCRRRTEHDKRAAMFLIRLLLS